MKISKTFIISLPHRLTDRLIPLIDYVKELGLDYRVVSAIKDKDGKRGLVFTIEQLFSECLIEMIGDDFSEFSRFIVLEDDCRFLINPTETINKCLEQLPDNFDLCFLGCNLWQNRVYKYSENLIQLEDAYATHAIIYSKAGIKKVLDAIHDAPQIIPLDILIKEKVMPDGLCFCSFPLLATQMDSFSDIENKPILYSKILEERFKEKTAHL